MVSRESSVLWNLNYAYLLDMNANLLGKSTLYRSPYGLFLNLRIIAETAFSNDFDDIVGDQAKWAFERT